MAVKIRLMRIGARGRPFYRVVAVDERAKRTGGYLELLGTYNPLTEPKEVNLKQDRVDAWIKNGAVLSDGFLRIIGKAKQRQPRKPKKEKAPTSAPAVTAPAVKEEAATEGGDVTEQTDVREETSTVEVSTPTEQAEVGQEGETVGESPEAKGVEEEKTEEGENK